MLMHFKKQVQIEGKTYIRTLLFDKAFTYTLTKYFNYNNVFLINNIVKLPKYT